MTALGLMTAAMVVLGLGCFLCYLTVVIQMFMHEEVGWALIGLFCCTAVPFFFGWSKANEWDNVLLMIAWTVCSVCYIVACIICVPMLHSV